MIPGIIEHLSESRGVDPKFNVDDEQERTDKKKR